MLQVGVLTTLSAIGIHGIQELGWDLEVGEHHRAGQAVILDLVEHLLYIEYGLGQVAEQGLHLLL